MIQMHLHELLLLDWPKKKWPDTFRSLTAAIEWEIAPQLRDQTLDALGEKVADAPPVDGETRNTFDRTPCHALADWCKENDEPHLERACKFLIRNAEVQITRKSYYSDKYRWQFTEKTMPEGWKYVSPSDAESFGKLLAALAAEIQERLEQLGM